MHVQDEERVRLVLVGRRHVVDSALCTQQPAMRGGSSSETVEMVYGARFRGYRASIYSACLIFRDCDSTWQG